MKATLRRWSREHTIVFAIASAIIMGALMYALFFRGDAHPVPSVVITMALWFGFTLRVVKRARDRERTSE